MNISIKASNESPVSYIVDVDDTKETDRAIGLAVGRGGYYPIVSYVWFPKHYLKIQDQGSKRMKVIIPAWLMRKKRETGELLDGFDII